MGDALGEDGTGRHGTGRDRRSSRSFAGFKCAPEICQKLSLDSDGHPGV